jgi:hypothetical protein
MNMKAFLRMLMTASIFLTIGCQSNPQLPPATTIPEQAVSLSPTETNMPRQVFPQTPVPTTGVTDGSADVPAGITPDPNSQQIVQIAVDDLAKRLQIGAEKISVSSVEATIWPDGSLGCPKQGVMYTQVLTPGFKLILEVEGRSYPYHTDENETVVLCGAGSGAEHFLVPTP